VLGLLPVLIVRTLIGVDQNGQDETTPVSPRVGLAEDTGVDSLLKANNTLPCSGRRGGLQRKGLVVVGPVQAVAACDGIMLTDLDPPTRHCPVCSTPRAEGRLSTYRRPLTYGHGEINDFLWAW